MPVVGKIFGGLDFSNYFIMLSNPPAGYNGPMTYDALTKAGVPFFAYGNFITVAINLSNFGFHHLLDHSADQSVEKARPAGSGRRRGRVLLRQIRDSLQQ